MYNNPDTTCGHFLFDYVHPHLQQLLLLDDDKDNSSSDKDEIKAVDDSCVPSEGDNDVKTIT